MNPLSIYKNEEEVMNLINKEICYRTSPLAKYSRVDIETLGYILMGYRHWVTNKNTDSVYMQGTINDSAWKYGIKLAQTDENNK